MNKVEFFTSCYDLEGFLRDNMIEVVCLSHAIYPDDESTWTLIYREESVSIVRDMTPRGQ
ncbi:hypothetical protein KAR91_40670 [Candidatus Pacearchaeota archaeon]|nr:hypothetical protein [Candidatus Pacearchaeota archaeon]